LGKKNWPEKSASPQGSLSGHRYRLYLVIRIRLKVKVLFGFSPPGITRARIPIAQNPAREY
jgi:hypothetical protein